MATSLLLPFGLNSAEFSDSAQRVREPFWLLSILHRLEVRVEGLFRPFLADFYRRMSGYVVFLTETKKSVKSCAITYFSPIKRTISV